MPLFSSVQSMITYRIFLREDMFKAAPMPPAPAPPGFGVGGRQPYAGQEVGITFDRFVRACVVIKQLTESFQRLDTDSVSPPPLNYQL